MTPAKNRTPELTTVHYWTDLLRPIFCGKKVIVTGDPVAGLLPTARLVRELGAESTFILGTQGAGTGDLPDPADGEWLALDPPPTKSFLEAILAAQALLGDLPESALTALDKYDPDHTAIVLGTHFNQQSELAGRKALAYRKPEWLALEDKTVIDALWDKAGVAREPVEIVTMDKTSILIAGKHLDKGYGTVWSGDARSGFHGGAEGTRWIRNRTDEDEATEYFSTRCDHVRVMPFLEGIPCSIHGIVFPDYSAALRPVEMVVLRRPNSGHLFYAGAATFWDAEPADREYMRSIAKRVGDTLREEVGYHGIFTLDGVMTKAGFRPTELNPRSGAGIRPLVRGLPHIPLQLIADALSAGMELDYRPAELEELIIQTADKERAGGTWRIIPDKITAIDSKPLTLQSGSWRWAQDDEPADGIVVAGVDPNGSFARLALDSARTSKGPPVAPLACAFWRFVDEEMGGNVGMLEPAVQVR
jgi:hypothetical protein